VVAAIADSSDRSIGVLVKGRRNVSIRNGRLHAFCFGVHAVDCEAVEISQVDVIGALKAALTIGGDRARVLGCRVDGVGGSPDKAEAYAVGINIVSGDHALVERCFVSEVYRQTDAVPSVTGEGCAILCGYRSGPAKIRGNVFVNARAEAKTIGIWGGEGGTHLVEDNLVRNFCLGIQGGGTASHPTDAVNNALWIDTLLAGSEGLCIAYGRLEHNLVVGFASGGRPGTSPGSNTMISLPTLLPSTPSDMITNAS
jgi:hypothetical protein